MTTTTAPKTAVKKPAVTKKKMGRPRIAIDQEDFEKLCGLHATLREIAGWFNCSEDTIENWSKRTYGTTFSDIYKQKSAKGKVSLRRKQMEIALSGNVTMLIWLGKQVLHQKDRSEFEHSGGENLPIEIVLTNANPHDKNNNGRNADSDEEAI